MTSFSVKATKWSIRQNQETPATQEENEPIGSYYTGTTYKGSSFTTKATEKPSTVSDSARREGSAQGMTIHSVPSAMEDYN